MAKRFLASVGYAEAFRKNGDKMELAFVSKSLTDSGLSITTTKDDIRGGQGAPIQFSFFHDANVEITLTDVQWKPEYLEAQLGVKFDQGHESYITKEILFNNGSATLTEDYPAVKEMPIVCDLNNKYLAWGAKKGTENYEDITVTNSGRTLTLKGSHSGEETYCVRYLANNDKAQVAEITSQILPDELYLIISAPIFAGDACSASHGRAAGSIQFEVPRFQLNGAQDFAMNMSSNQTMSLSGTAMAAPSLECEDKGGRLLRIIEVNETYDWKSDVESLIVDAESVGAGESPSVYAVLKDGHLKLVAHTDLTFTPALVEDKAVAGTSYVIKLNGTNISTEMSVPEL